MKLVLSSDTEEEKKKKKKKNRPHISVSKMAKYQSQDSKRKSPSQILKYTRKL